MEYGAKEEGRHLNEKGCCLMIWDHRHQPFIISYRVRRLFCCSYGCDVRIDTLIPVQEAFHIDLVADLKLLYSLVYV